jgi:hypothetical protein
MATVAILVAGPVKADTITDDPLHFSCGNCLNDNGTVTPTTGGAPTDITVTSSPARSGDLTLKILVPNNFTAPATDAVTGMINGTSFTGTAHLFSTTAWTSGDLDSGFLGITNFANGAPPNPLNAWLPSTDSVDPGATGFFVLTLDLGQVSLNSPGGSSPIDLSLGSLGLGGLVLGDLMTADGDVTTAQSAALFVEPQLAATPIPNTLALMIGGLLFIFGAGKKWGRKEPMSATYGMTAA